MSEHSTIDKHGIKILHLIDSLSIYGAEAMLLSLMEQQLKIGINPVLGSIGRKAEKEKLIEAAARSIEVPVARFSACKGIDLLSGIKIIRWARLNKISAIHTHGYKPNLLIAFFPKKWRKVPIIRTLHGWTNITNLSKDGIYQILDILSLRFTEKLISVSNAMLQKYPLLNTSLQIQIIENGIKEPEFKFPKDDEIHKDKIYSFGKDSYSLLSIGRLSKEKGYDNLILGLALLIREGLDLKLCIIGEGPERKHLETIIKEQNLQERVFLAGYRQNAYRFMPFFDSYILSSYTEGLPITILEAMHMELPIIATKVGSIPEVLEGGKSGLLIYNNKPTCICANLKIFIKDVKGRDERVKRAKLRAQSTYSAKAMGQKYKNAYLQLIQSRYKYY